MSDILTRILATKQQEVAAALAPNRLLIRRIIHRQT